MECVGGKIMTNLNEKLEIVSIKNPEELAVSFEYKKDAFSPEDFLIGCIGEHYYLTTKSWEEIGQISNALYVKKGNLDKLEIKSISNEPSHSSSATNYLYQVNSNELNFIMATSHPEDDYTTSLFGTEYHIDLKNNTLISKRLDREVDNKKLDEYLSLYQKQRAVHKIVVS